MQGLWIHFLSSIHFFIQQISHCDPGNALEDETDHHGPYILASPSACCSSLWSVLLWPGDGHMLILYVSSPLDVGAFSPSSWALCPSLMPNQHRAGPENISGWVIPWTLLLSSPQAHFIACNPLVGLFLQHFLWSRGPGPSVKTSEGTLKQMIPW